VTERVPSDHDAVESHRVHLSTVGRTSRFQLSLPEELSCESGDVVSLSLAGDQAYAEVETTLDGEPAIRGAFPDRNLARNRDGRDEFDAWLRDAGASAGDPLVLDVLTTGYAYGLRLPGDRVVYAAPEQPDSSLQSIAKSLDE
jgi:hypothetical protein